MHNIPDFLKISSEMQQHFKKGGMIKRADGSYSRRGLWDNIRANKGSGRKPTKEMLEQEAKIRAKEQYGGTVHEYGNGGYTVRRSNARKGKTHVVIGPDGTKKYFGDSKLGQHPRDPERKKAFYARHKHNLANNPYFRAFARATWEEGGEVPEFEPGGYYAMPQARIEPSDIHLNLPNTTHNQMSPLGLNTFLVNDKRQGVVIGGVNPRFQTEDFSVGPYARMVGNRQFQAPMYGVAGTYHVNDNIDVNGEVGSNGFSAGLNYHFKRGGNYGPFYGRRDAAKLQRWRTPMASSMTPRFDVGGLTKYQVKGFVDDSEGTSYMPQEQAVTGNSGQGINTTTPQQSPAVAATTPATTGTFNPSNNPFVTGSANTSGGGLGPVKYGPFNPNPGTPPDQSLANTGLSGSEIANRNQEYEDRMIKEYGITRKEIDKRYGELSAKYTNSTPEDIYSAMSKEFGDQFKQNKQDEALKAEKTRLKTIAGGLKGASQAFDAAFAGADLLSRMNPNSSQMAVLRKNRENANPTNTMNIVGNRKGIEYAAHGGYTGLKEGVELDLTTQQIHELEKQGYKFQIL